MPAWMGVLPKLTFLEIVAVELEAWPSAGFTSLQSLGMLTCGVEKVRLLCLDRWARSIVELTGMCIDILSNLAASC